MAARCRPAAIPALDELLVRSGGDGQLGDLPVPGCILASFAEAERGAGAFGQQVDVPRPRRPRPVPAPVDAGPRPGGAKPRCEPAGL
jgi:hypothetical protein